MIIAPSGNDRVSLRSRWIYGPLPVGQRLHRIEIAERSDAGVESYGHGSSVDSEVITEAAPPFICCSFARVMRHQVRQPQRRSATLSNPRGARLRPVQSG